MNINKAVEQAVIEAIRQINVEKLIKTEVKEAITNSLKSAVKNCLQDISKLKVTTTTTNTQKLLNEHEVAEILRVSAPTLRKWRWEGKGPQFVKIGQRVAYKLEEINSYINLNTHSNTL
jgi:predicted DNA-binding transcriptional regulator AlpA